MALLDTLNEIQSTSQLRADYLKTLALLAALKSGEITLDRIEMVETGWRLVETGDALIKRLEEEQEAAKKVFDEPSMTGRIIRRTAAQERLIDK